MRRALLAITLLAVLSTPLFFAQINAQAGEPSVAFARAGYKDSPYTGFNITAPTQDGGRVDVIFTWEIASKWRGWREGDSLRVYDTYPTLQMVRFLGDGSLDYSLTYIPLYLIQFDDVNGNGIFDVRTRTSLAKEVFDEEVDWSLSSDRVLRMYPLAPMLSRLERGEPSYTWTWGVSNPIKANGRFEYVWNTSASVENFGWRFVDSRHRVEKDSVDVRLGYHLSFKPEGSTVKLEYGIEDVKWVSGVDVKLALISAVLYQGMDEVVVREEGKYEGFSGASAKDRTVALVEKAGESVKSLIAQSADAVVDGVHRKDVVTSALQPVFVVSTPPDVPEGVNVKGLNPGFGDTAYWRHSVAFAQQLAFPHFKEKVFQDPLISLVAPLLIPLPTTLISPQWFIIASVAVFIVYALLRATLRRSLREPFVGA